MNLKTAKTNYPLKTQFFTATQMIAKRPLTVTSLMEASHYDRKEQIKSLEQHILSIHNITFPKRFKNKYDKIDFSVCLTFLREIEKEKTERDYLVSLDSDIIEAEGGVIYDGEYKVWAKIVV